MLVRSPLSSMHRRPSEDLYRLELHPSPTDEYNDGLIDGEGDDEDEPVIRVAEIPSHTKLMKRWRDILGAFLSHNGVQHGEVDIECLHWLGYQGEDLAPFIRDRYQAQSPYGAICLGFGIPFVLDLKVTSDLSLRSMQGGFAIAYDETTKRLAIRPLSYLNTRELPRVPFWPRTMASCRVPTQISWTLGIDTTAGQGWTAVRQQALDEGSVRVAVVLTRLPSGHSTLALPGEGPGLLKSRHLAYNGDGTIPGARFAKVHISKEARSLLNGKPPEPIRVRDLDVWNHVSEIAPLPRGAETTDIIGKPVGPAILSNIKDYIAEPPSPEGEYESTGVDNLFDVSLFLTTIADLTVNCWACTGLLGACSRSRPVSSSAAWPDHPRQPGDVSSINSACPLFRALIHVIVTRLKRNEKKKWPCSQTTSPHRSLLQSVHDPYRLVARAR